MITDVQFMYSEFNLVHRKAGVSAMPLLLRRHVVFNSALHFHSFLASNINCWKKFVLYTGKVYHCLLSCSQLISIPHIVHHLCLYLWRYCLRITNWKQMFFSSKKQCVFVFVSSPLPFSMLICQCLIENTPQQYSTNIVIKCSFNTYIRSSCFQVKVACY